MSKRKTKISLSDAKQIIAEKWGKKDWSEVQRDYEYGLGIMKAIDFEELMDSVAELYKGGTND